MPNTREKPIEQKLKNGAESICNKCFHGKVCRAIDNQPCIECNQFTDANGVTVQEWISVKERLPNEGDVVLVYDKYRCLYIGRYLYDGVFNAVGWHINTSAVAWMPLPEPPKGE